MQRRLLGAAAAGALLLFTGCGDSTAASTATLRVMLTDAPFPFDQVARADVHVMRIDAKMEDSDESEVARLDGDEPENRDPRRGWVTIATPDQSYDLLELQNGRTANLGQLTLPTGTYRSFRLVLDTGRSSVTLTDGSHPDVTWPSAGQSGIKVKLDRPISLVEGGTVMVVDFDLGRSFVLRGNSIRNNGLLFRPVVRAAARDASGALAGSVSCDGDGVGQASVEVLAAGTAVDDADPAKVVATTASDEDGAFRVELLTPARYTVRATRPAAAATSCATAALSGDVEVGPGATTAADVVLPTL
jgi:hypothetical protein